MRNACAYVCERLKQILLLFFYWKDKMNTYNNIWISHTFKCTLRNCRTNDMGWWWWWRWRCERFIRHAHVYISMCVFLLCFDFTSGFFLLSRSTANNVSNDRSSLTHKVFCCFSLLFLDGISLSPPFFSVSCAVFKSSSTNNTIEFTRVTLSSLSSMNHNDRTKRWTK